MTAKRKRVEPSLWINNCTNILLICLLYVEGHFPQQSSRFHINTEIGQIPTRMTFSAAQAISLNTDQAWHLSEMRLFLKLISMPSLPIQKAKSFFCHIFFLTLNGTLKNGSVLLFQKWLVNCQNKKIVEAMWHRGAPQDTDTDQLFHFCTDRKSCRSITVKRNKPLTALTPLCCLHIWYFALSFCSAPWQAGCCHLFHWLKVGWKRIYFVSVTARRSPAEASSVSNREGKHNITGVHSKQSAEGKQRNTAPKKLRLTPEAKNHHHSNTHDCLPVLL